MMWDVSSYAGGGLDLLNSWDVKKHRQLVPYKPKDYLFGAIYRYSRSMNVETTDGSESRRTHTRRPSTVLPVMELNNQKQSCALNKKLEGERGQTTCLWVDVLWRRSGCWVAKGVAMDRSARYRMLSWSRLKLRQSRIMPGCCLIQVTETHNKSKQICCC